MHKYTNSTVLPVKYSEDFKSNSCRGMQARLGFALLYYLIGMPTCFISAFYFHLHQHPLPYSRSDKHNSEGALKSRDNN
jgi:hypothetical protein